MQIYRQEEGMWARMPLAIVGGLVTVSAARAAMGVTATNWKYLWLAGVFLVLGAVTLYLAFFHRKTGELLIDTETEMRKVVWPTREEVTGSTTVVIGTIALLGVAIYVMDILLTEGLQLAGVY